MNINSLLSSFLKDENGVQTIEMVIVLVVLVSIAFSFRKTLVNWYNDLINEAASLDTSVTGVAEPSLKK